MASLRFRLRQHYWKWTAPGQIRNYLNASKTRKLQLGCGSNLLTGWLNTTLYPFDKGSVFMDVTLPFPMPDSSFDYIFSEHMIEHLEFEQAAWMLSESFPGQSGDEHLHDIEQHGEYVKNHQAMLYETMVFEAVKP